MRWWVRVPAHVPPGRLRCRLQVAQRVDAPVVHSNNAQQCTLLASSLPCLSFPTPFPEMTSQIHYLPPIPDLWICFWGNPNYDSHQHPFMNLRKRDATSYLDSTLSLNFSSCHLWHTHGRECSTSYLRMRGKELGSSLPISMKARSFFTLWGCRGHRARLTLVWKAATLDRNLEKQ